MLISSVEISKRTYHIAIYRVQISSLSRHWNWSHHRLDPGMKYDSIYKRMWYMEQFVKDFMQEKGKKNSLITAKI